METSCFHISASSCSSLHGKHRCLLLNESVKKPISNRVTCTWWKNHNPKSLIALQVNCLRNVAVADSSIDSPPALDNEEEEKEGDMLIALKERRTEDAWKIMGQLKELPSGACLSRLVAQFAYHGTPSSISRAQTIVKRLQDEKKLHLLDCHSLGLLAMAAAKTGVPRYGAAIIRLMLKLDLFPHVKAWSAVLSRLGKCPHELNSAFDLFESICERVKEAGELDDDGVAHMKPDTGAFNAILNACAIAGHMERAEDLIKRMDLYGVRPDVLTYNIMIKLYARVERKDLLVGVIEEMLEKHIEPCITTFNSLVAAHVGLDDLETAEMIVQAMREGRRDICAVLRGINAEVRPSDEMLIDSEEAFSQNQHSKSILSPQNKAFQDQIKPAVSTANLLLPRSYKPNSQIYTLLMKGYMQKGRLDDVLQMLRAMQIEDDSQSHPDEVTYTTAISAFVRMGLMDEARKVLQEMAANKVPANLITYNILLNGYCRLGQMQKAEALMRDMKEAGIAPDVVSYNTLINGCIGVDDNLGALTYFNEMREAAIPPSVISYTTLMKAFTMNRQARLAEKVFEEMQKDPRVRVDIVAWNMLIESYSRAGLMDDAKNIFLQMKEQKLHPTVATYGSLVNGFAKARKPGEALVLWKEIQERTMAKNGEDGVEPLEPDEVLLDSLVDVCVRAAFFRRALEIIACMEQLKIPPKKTKYKRMFVEMHSRIYTSRHASPARQARRVAQKRAAEGFKFWLGLPNNYYESEWQPEFYNEQE